MDSILFQAKCKKKNKKKETKQKNDKKGNETQISWTDHLSVSKFKWHISFSPSMFRMQPSVEMEVQEICMAAVPWSYCFFSI